MPSMAPRKTTLQILLLPCLFGLAVLQSDVRMPPSITADLQTRITYKQSRTIPFNCSAVGTPSPSYELWKDGALSLSNPNGQFFISNADSTNEGWYQCKAKNQFGVSVSDVLFAQMAVQNLYTDDTVTSNTVAANSNLKLLCNAPSSVPSATYYWSAYNNTGDRITGTKSIQLNDNGDIYFGSIDANYNGRSLQCNAENTASGSTASGSYSRIIISGSVASSANTFQFGTSNLVTGLEGQAFSFRCFFSGYPVPNILWYYNDGKQIPPDRWTTGDFETRLTRRNVLTIDDNATYECRAGTTSHLMVLNIEAAPSFRTTDDRPHNMNVTDADTVTISCNAYANPPAAVTWFANGTALTSTLPNKYSLSQDSLTLTIRDVCKNCADGSNDLVVIQCNATNTHGSIFAEGYVNVLEATVIDSQSVSKDWEANQNVTFTCEASTDPSTELTRKWYFKDEPIVNEEKIFVDSAGSLHIIMDGEGDSSRSRCGVYRCEVTNGVSNSSIEAVLVDPISTQTAGLWWISLIFVGLILLLLLLLLLWFFCLRNNEGDTYLVDERERKNGNDPVKELSSSGFQNYHGQDSSTSSSWYASTNQKVPLVTPARYTDDGHLNTLPLTNDVGVEGGSLLRPTDPNNFNTFAPQRYDPFTSGV